MYQKVECINCGRTNPSNVRKCHCGTMQHSKNDKPEFFSEKARCYVMGCAAKADERRGDNFWMCRKHSDDWILKTQPDSIESIVILGSRKIEAEAKAAGMTNREYFEKSNPMSFDAVQKMMIRKNEGRDNIFAVEDYLNGG
jgi:hypothetical protein